MPGIELRPRSGTEIVDAAFQLYRRHFAPLVTISAVILTPLIVLSLILTGGDPTIQATRPVASIALVFVAWILGSLSEAAVVLAVSESVMQGAMDAGAALRRTLRRAFAILVAALMKWFIIVFAIAVVAAIVPMVMVMIGGGIVQTGALTRTAAVGVVLILVAFALGGGIGLFYYACYFAVSAAVIVENVGPRAALTRSRALSMGLRRKILSTLGTPMFILLVIQFVVALMVRSLPGPIAIGFVLQQATTIILTPVVAIIATLLYYDARIRNEGFDLEVMTAELGAPVTPTV
jgi:hypothetical protein